jgi:hypothetical protein
VGLLPYLAATGVIGQPIDVLDKPPGMQLFDRLDDPGVQGPAAFGQERTVGNVVGQVPGRETGGFRRSTLPPAD